VDAGSPRTISSCRNNLIPTNKKNSISIGDRFYVRTEVLKIIVYPPRQNLKEDELNLAGIGFAYVLLKYTNQPGRDVIKIYQRGRCATK